MWCQVTSGRHYSARDFMNSMEGKEHSSPGFFFLLLPVIKGVLQTLHTHFDVSNGASVWMNYGHQSCEYTLIISLVMLIVDR